MNSVSGVTPASQHDVLIVGGGAAGLTLALSLANRLLPGPRTRRVTLLRPAREAQGASRWAQGGIAAVLAPEDDVESHVADTLIAGDGLCNERAVRFTVGHSREAIEWLIALGVPFTPADADASYPFHLTREGGMAAAASSTPPTPPGERCSIRSAPTSKLTRTSRFSKTCWPSTSRSTLAAPVVCG